MSIWLNIIQQHIIALKGFLVIIYKKLDLESITDLKLDGIEDLRGMGGFVNVLVLTGLVGFVCGFIVWLILTIMK